MADASNLTICWFAMQHISVGVYVKDILMQDSLQFEYDYNVGHDILFMFAKVKQFVVEKAFGLAFMRYDRNSSGMLDKDELASLINDAFQLLKIPRQVSWIETAVLLKMFDQDNNDQISKQEAHDAFKNALAKFGGIGGLAQIAGFGKSKGALEDDPYSHIPSDAQEGDLYCQTKISGKLDYVPPEDIDESMLQKLPPVGQNLNHDDLKNHPPAQKNENAWSSWQDQPQQGNSGNSGNSGNWSQWDQASNQQQWNQQQQSSQQQENQQWSSWGQGPQN